MSAMFGTVVRDMHTSSHVTFITTLDAIYHYHLLDKETGAQQE